MYICMETSDLEELDADDAPWGERINRTGLGTGGGFGRFCDKIKTR